MYTGPRKPVEFKVKLTSHMGQRLPSQTGRDLGAMPQNYDAI